MLIGGVKMFFRGLMLWIVVIGNLQELLREASEEELFHWPFSNRFVCLYFAYKFEMGKSM